MKLILAKIKTFYLPQFKQINQEKAKLV